MTVDVMQRDSASRKEETVVAERSRIETETFKVDELVQSNAHDLPGSIPSVTVTPQLTRKDKPAEVLLQKVIVEVKTSFDPVEEQNHKAHSLPTPPLEVPSDETSPVGVNVPVAPPPPPPGAVKIRVEDVGTSNENLGRKSVEAITACRAKAERLPATLIALPISVQARIADHLDILSIFHLTATHRSLHLHRSLHHARHLVRSSTDGIPGSIRALLTSPSPLHIHDGPSHAEKILMHILKILNPCIEDEIAKGPNVGTAGFRSARAGFIGNPGRRLGPRALDPLLEFAIAEGFSWAVSKLLYAGSTSKSSLNRFLGRCAESGDTVAAVAFLGAGADPNASINFPVIEFHGGGFGNVDGSCLAVAAAMGNEGVVAALLEAGADASLFESLALRACAASTLGTGEIAARLILGGADPASHAHEAIRRAALRGSPGVLRVLVGVIAGTVKVKWEVRSVIRVAYESAAKAGHAEAVREMLKERQTWMWGSGLEGPGSVLRTAVLAAIGGGWVEVVRAFAESEAWGDVVAGEDGKGVVELH
ncbi:hypothetical protein BC829DRAFT_9716 [Chytridium lagenaria]|nr:hypothetical protein BC829DRAFT_9716 [Chytridium lagenaria]